MAERILPAPDLFATCPIHGKILENYSGIFEAVLVVLHPFIKAASIGSEQFVPATYPAAPRSVCVASQFHGQRLSPKQGFLLLQHR